MGQPLEQRPAIGLGGRAEAYAGLSLQRPTEAERVLVSDRVTVIIVPARNETELSDIVQARLHAARKALAPSLEEWNTLSFKDREATRKGNVLVYFPEEEGYLTVTGDPDTFHVDELSGRINIGIKTIKVVEKPAQTETKRGLRKQPAVEATYRTEQIPGEVQIAAVSFDDGKDVSTTSILTMADGKLDWVTIKTSEADPFPYAIAHAVRTPSDMLPDILGAITGDTSIPRKQQRLISLGGRRSTPGVMAHIHREVARMVLGENLLPKGDIVFVDDRGSGVVGAGYEDPGFIRFGGAYEPWNIIGRKREPEGVHVIKEQPVNFLFAESIDLARFGQLTLAQQQALLSQNLPQGYDYVRLGINPLVAGETRPRRLQGDIIPLAKEISTRIDKSFIRQLARTQAIIDGELTVADLVDPSELVLSILPRKGLDTISAIGQANQELRTIIAQVAETQMNERGNKTRQAIAREILNKDPRVVAAIEAGDTQIQSTVDRLALAIGGRDEAETLIHVEGMQMPSEGTRESFKDSFIAELTTGISGLPRELAERLFDRLHPVRPDSETEVVIDQNPDAVLGRFVAGLLGGSSDRATQIRLAREQGILEQVMPLIEQHLPEQTPVDTLFKVTFVGVWNADSQRAAERLLDRATDLEDADRELLERVIADKFDRPTVEALTAKVKAGVAEQIVFGDGSHNLADLLRGVLSPNGRVGEVGSNGHRESTTAKAETTE